MVCSHVCTHVYTHTYTHVYAHVCAQEIVFTIKDDQGSESSFQNVKSYADLISKISGVSGFERSDSLALEYLVD